MMNVNDFLKYEINLKISYEDYFRLIYDNKYLIEARLGPDRTFIAKKSVYGNSRKKAVQKAVQWFWKDFDEMMVLHWCWKDFGGREGGGGKEGGGVSCVLVAFCFFRVRDRRTCGTACG